MQNIGANFNLFYTIEKVIIYVFQIEVISFQLLKKFELRKMDN